MMLTNAIGKMMIFEKLENVAKIVPEGEEFVTKNYRLRGSQVFDWWVLDD